MAYNVFLSSTFADFSDERRRISELLRLIQVNAILAENMGDQGKDLATTLTNLIDECKMIVLLIGSRAGSRADTGEPWTQKEAKYAFSKNKRVFAYIREVPQEDKTLFDVDTEEQKSVNEFIDYIEGKIALVPRFKKDECCRLTAMVIRDLDRYSRELRDQEEEKAYMDGFE